jgi:hypothetical protein
MVRTTKQKTSKEIDWLSNTIGQPDLTDYTELSAQQQQNTLFSQVQMGRFPD